MRKAIIFFLCVCIVQHSSGQKKDSTHKSGIYMVNFKIELSILVAGIVGAQYGLAKLPEHASLTPAEVLCFG